MMAGMNAAPTVYAIDFGTSNSLLAAANRDEVFPAIPLEPAAADPTILRSILYFPSADRFHVGEDALAKYVENGLEGRFLRSLKRHLSSRSFRGTYIGERPMLVEDLVAVILREMRRRANAHFDVDVRRVVLGRPARFSADDRDDDFAERRLRSAAERAGFEEIHFLPEPVAAAREFRAVFTNTGRADHGCFLVGDFGGGTSDFTVMRVGRGPFTRDDVLAIGGVALAGDALDSSIMRSHVAKHFGAEVTYRVPLGNNVLGMPLPIVEQLCSPAHLSILRRPDVAEFLRSIRSWSLGERDKEKLDQLATLVDDALGFQLFEIIENAKRRLSTEDAADVDFVYPSIEVHERVTRVGFERSAERTKDAILRCLDETVERAGVGCAGIDVVCCTGGTARVPVLAGAIAERFGEQKMHRYRSFHAVVEGLAEHARTIAAEASSR
jgi:hypothetical chaperone protein